MRLADNVQLSIVLFFVLFCHPIFFIFTAESLSWFTLLMVSLPPCFLSFQSLLFLIDSQSPPTLLSSATTFFQPMTFCNVCLPKLFFLFIYFALNFQWIPGHAGLPGNELETSLPKSEHHSLPLKGCALSIGPIHCNDGSLRLVPPETKPFS